MAGAYALSNRIGKTWRMWYSAPRKAVPWPLSISSCAATAARGNAETGSARPQRRGALRPSCIAGLAPGRGCYNRARRRRGRDARRERASSDPVRRRPVRDSPHARGVGRGPGVSRRRIPLSRRRDGRAGGSDPPCGGRVSFPARSLARPATWRSRSRGIRSNRPRSRPAAPAAPRSRTSWGSADRAWLSARPVSRRWPYRPGGAEAPGGLAIP